MVILVIQFRQRNPLIAPQADLNVNSAPMSSMGNRSALEVGNVSR